MKTLTITLLSILLVLFLSSSCEETLNTENGGNNTNYAEGEEVGEKVSADYNGSDLQLDFSDGAKFSVKARDNSASKNGTIEVFIVNNERYFNSENSVVFDFSKLKSEYVFELDYPLPKDLVEEDIALIIYSPENSNEKLDAVQINFSYDKESGIINAKFKAPSDEPSLGKISKKKNKALNGKYYRLLLSFGSRKELAEKPETLTIKMPFYEQPGGTCWAACATMLARAYAPIKDRKKEIRIIDFLKTLKNTTINDGIGIWDFKYNLPAALETETGVKFETSTFVSTTNLLSEIMSKLIENKPVILKLNYPDLGGHAILVVGYEIELISVANISIKLKYHNPSNTNNDGMYKLADFDWLMKEKSWMEAYQIIYAKDDAVPESRALQTIGMPLRHQFGEFAFIVPVKKHDGTMKYFPVEMQYNKEAKNAYVWIYNYGNVEVSEIPDSATTLKLKLPIYNAAQKSENLTIRLRAYDDDSGKLIYDLDEDAKSYSPGESFYEKELLLSEFGDATQKRNVRMEIQLWSESVYQEDYYAVHFTLLPKKQIEFSCVINMMSTLKLIYISKEGYQDTTFTKERIFYLNARKVIMTRAGSGKRFEGSYEDEYEIDGDTYKSILTVVLEYDTYPNPNTIKYLLITENSDDCYSDFERKTEESIEFKNINISDSDNTGNGLEIWRYKNNVCNYINNVSYLRNVADVVWGGGLIEELISYKCDDDSELSILIK